MGECFDPFLQQLTDDLDAAKAADVPVLAEVRECRERIIRYFTECVREEMRRHAMAMNREPPFRVIANDGPVRHNPRRMSSPMKTDEIRDFEDTVSRVFGIRASAMTEWARGFGWSSTNRGGSPRQCL